MARGALRGLGAALSVLGQASGGRITGVNPGTARGVIDTGRNLGAGPGGAGVAGEIALGVAAFAVHTVDRSALGPAGALRVAADTVLADTAGALCAAGAGLAVFLPTHPGAGAGTCAAALRIVHRAEHGQAGARSAGVARRGAGAIAADAILAEARGAFRGSGAGISHGLAPADAAAVDAGPVSRTGPAVPRAAGLIAEAAFSVTVVVYRTVAEVVALEEEAGGARILAGGADDHPDELLHPEIDVLAKVVVALESPSQCVVALVHCCYAYLHGHRDGYGWQHMHLEEVLDGKGIPGDGDHLLDNAVTVLVLVLPLHGETAYCPGLWGQRAEHHLGARILGVQYNNQLLYILLAGQVGFQIHLDGGHFRFLCHILCLLATDKEGIQCNCDD